MATLIPEKRENALAQAGYALAPVETDPAAAALTTSQRFPASGSWGAGETIIVVASDSFHLVAGGSAIAATTASPGAFPAGVYKFALPDGCTHVAMIQASGATAIGCAYKG